MSQQRWDELVDSSVGGPVTAGTMFGSRGLRTGTKFFAVWWHDQLVLKLPPTTIDQLVTSGSGTPFEPMEGRRMNGWVVVDDSADWAELAGEAREFVESQQR
jgi:TfoX/Sxy family transcriptional regulator of competence genes